MYLIAHRVNTVSHLRKTPPDYGVELDIRYHEDELVLHHDPFGHHRDVQLARFQDLLDAWNHTGPLILNVKTEGIEQKCIDLVTARGIKNWFFLDLSMPYFVAYARKAAAGVIPGFGPDNLAVRFSEYESIHYATGFSGMAGWVWVDCFTRMPLNEKSYVTLKNAGFKICLVSPELQKHPLSRIDEFRKQLDGMTIDAVCTKRPDLWL